MADSTPNPLFAEGDTFTENSTEFEVTAISTVYDHTSTPQHFIYQIRPKAEVDAERKAAADAAAAEEKAKADAEKQAAADQEAINSVTPTAQVENKAA